MSLPSPSWRLALQSYLDRRLFWVFLLGCASGFPWLLIGSNMSGWLKDADLTRTAIGLFGSVFVVYAINWMWAPFVDRIKLPYLHQKLGQRRSWIIMTQTVMLVCTLAIANINLTKMVDAPSGAQINQEAITSAENNRNITDSQTKSDANKHASDSEPQKKLISKEAIILLSSLAFLVAIASATQDIAIDAYRIDSFNTDEKDKLPQAAAMSVIGWWTGYSLPGYFAFANADSVGWNNVYFGMAGFIVLLILFTLFIKEPDSDRDALQAEAKKRYTGKIKYTPLIWLSVTIVEPFADFFRRNGVKVALTLLLFVFLFKIGEAFLGRMSLIFYKEIGFSNEQIGHYSKLIGWGTTIIFTLIGSAINVRFGVIKGLLIGGIAMASSNLMFALIAQVGPNEHLFLATIIVDNFTAAFATIAFVSFLTHLTGRAFSASQYALLASLGNLGRTSLSSFSGVLIDKIDSSPWLTSMAWLNPWTVFFVITTIMVLPSLIMILTLRSHLERHSSTK